MKKYLLLMLVTNLLLAEELEVNKEVQGVNQKVYTEVSEINTDKKEIKTGNVELIELGKSTAEIKTNDKVSIDLAPKENIDVVEMNDRDSLLTKKERESRVFFGMGGHDEITNYNYGIIDNSKIEKYDVNYNLLIKRETAEENRENTKVSTDLLDASFEKNKVKVDLLLEKGTQEFPGMSTASTQVKTDKEFTEFSTGISYELTSDTNIEFDYDYNSNSSDTVLTDTVNLKNYTRDYKYSTYELKGTKEFLYKDDFGSHSIDAIAGIIIEANESDDNRNILYVEGKNRFNIVKIENTDFIGKVRVEGGEKTNLSLDLDASKKLDDNIKINAGVEVKSSYKLKKDIIDDFYYVNDVVDFVNLRNEKVYSLSGGMTYTKDKVYAEVNASINSGDDLITYEAQEVSTGLERAIVPTNYEKSLVWLETELNTSYTMDERFRSAASLNLSSLTDIAYNPSLKASVEGIYTKDKYGGRLKYNFNGNMYTKNKGNTDRESIGSYGTIDLLNTYTFGNDYSVNFNITNLLDVNGKKMKDYDINGRVISVGLEIKY